MPGLKQGVLVCHVRIRVLDASDISRVSLFTSSLLLLDSKPASLCRLCFSATPSRRSRDGSSLNASPMFTGLGPPTASSPSSEPSLPRLVRFSDRSLLRVAHGRPGKRARAGCWMFEPATVAGDGNPPPDAAIIYHNNTVGALAEGDCGDVRGKMDRGREIEQPLRHHGKTNFADRERHVSDTLGEFACEDHLLSTAPGTKSSSFIYSKYSSSSISGQVVQFY